MIWMFASLAADAIKTGMEANHQRRMQEIQNDAIKAYNRQVVTTSAKGLNEINMQRTVSREQTAQAIQGVKRQALQERADRGLQAAASDTMGSSVEASLQDVDIQLGEATNTLARNQEIQEEAFNSAVNRTTDSAMSQLQNPFTGAGEGAVEAQMGSALGQIGTSMIANKLGGKGWFGGGKEGAPISAAAGTRTPTQQGWASFFGMD